MRYKTVNERKFNLEMADFMPSENSVREVQVMIHVKNRYQTYMSQCRVLSEAISYVLHVVYKDKLMPVYGRCFLSDVTNQYDQVRTILEQYMHCTVGYVQQPPLDGSKVALWLQLQSDCCLGNDGLSFYEHQGYRHYRTSFSGSHRSDSEQQTMTALRELEQNLNDRQCGLFANCVRTWFFVRDIDVNYGGVVTGRTKVFSDLGLLPSTHFIASTGIGGCAYDSATFVMMDSHCIKGIEQEQIHYLYAKEYLNATSDYGVTFERGVYMDYGDRRQVYISGTASIDKQGKILHVGDVLGQSRRAMENVKALLEEAKCTFDDVSQMIVYVRDPADYLRVKKLFDETFPRIPKQFVLAPVCRPGWLIEMECIAEKSITGNGFRNY